MQKKVAIMTLFHNSTNYGAILQAYALQKTIESMGLQCVVLDYQRKIVDITQKAQKPKSKIQKLIYKISAIYSKGDLINSCLQPIRKLWEKKYEKDIVNRKKKFREFIAENIPVSAFLDSSTIHSIQNEFDVFVCGSDQIWRPTTFDPNLFLGFVKQNKPRIAYAASLGVAALSDKEKEIYTPLINQLDAISVRESSAVSLVSGLTEKSVVRVLDPTLLLDHDYWRNNFSTKNQTLENEKYIFSYQIANNNANRELAKKTGKLLGMKVVAIPGLYRIQPYDFMYADINMTDASPEEFINLIAQSEYVITDSFHACVFAILFGKKFIALERFSRSDRLSMNSRIYDLLEMFSIPERLLTRSDQLEQLLNSDLDIQLDKWKQSMSSSKDFLIKNIIAD